MQIDGYIHKTGKNCESSVIRNVLSYYGTDYDEEFVFGLDSSIGFMYYKNDEDKIDLALGKNEIFTGKSLNYLGVKTRMINSLTGDSGWNKILSEYVYNNIPVIVRVDNALLPYWDVPLEANYGGYFVIVYGYDKENKEVLISDSEFDKTQRVSLNDFRIARSSKLSSPINPNNEIYILEKPTRVPDLSKIGPVAVKNVVRNFIASPMNNMGIKGLNKFKKAMEDWPNVKKGIISETKKDGTITTTNVLNFQLQQVARFIDGSGTGGSCYRGLYAIFLQKVYKLTNKNEYFECFNYLNESSKLWSNIATLFKEAGNDITKDQIVDVLATALDNLQSIIDLEKKTFTVLRRI